MPRHYEFRVSGRLSKHAHQSVLRCTELRIVPASLETALRGEVPDQADLPCVLAFLEGLDLRIVSFRRLPQLTYPKPCPRVAADRSPTRGVRVPTPPRAM